MLSREGGREGGVYIYIYRACCGTSLDGRQTIVCLSAWKEGRKGKGKQGRKGDEGRKEGRTLKKSKK